MRTVTATVPLALLLFAALPGSAAAEEAPPVRKIHLFILSGQSNMVHVRPRDSFEPELKKAFPGDDIIAVKDAEGTQSILRWYNKWKPAGGGEPKLEKGQAIGDLYDRLMVKVNEAVKDRKPDTVTFVWMQGERDANLEYGDVYAESLKGLLEQLQADLGRQDVNLVVGRLSDYSLNNTKYAHWMMVREAQMKVAEECPRGGWVDSDDLNGPDDDLHLTKQGYVELGRRFAAKAVELIRNGPRKSPDADKGNGDGNG